MGLSCTFGSRQVPRPPHIEVVRLIASRVASLTRDPELRIRDIGDLIGITERATVQILSQLEGSGVLAHELVEAGEVLVEPEHVRDCVREPWSEAAGDGFDPQLLLARRDAHRARATRYRQRRLERSRRQVDAIRRKLCDAVRQIVRAKSTGSPLAPLRGRSSVSGTAHTCHIRRALRRPPI
jgi:hypothetical protein